MTRDELYEELAEDSSSWVRCGVAAKATSQTVLRKLAQDPSMIVRLALTENVAAREEILEILTDDTDPTVSLAAWDVKLQLEGNWL